MSEIENKMTEISAEELDEVAGGAVSFTNSNVRDFKDAQVGFTAVGGKGNGGITTFNAQETTEFSAALSDFKATGDDFPQIR